MESLEAQLKLLIRKQKQVLKQKESKHKTNTPCDNYQDSPTCLSPTHLSSTDVSPDHTHLKIQQQQELIASQDRRIRELELASDQLEKQNTLYYHKIVELQALLQSNQHSKDTTTTTHKGVTSSNKEIQVKADTRSDKVCEKGTNTRAVECRISRMDPISINRSWGSPTIWNREGRESGRSRQEEEVLKPLVCMSNEEKQNPEASISLGLDLKQPKEEKEENIPQKRRRFYASKFKFREYH